MLALEQERFTLLDLLASWATGHQIFLDLSSHGCEQQLMLTSCPFLFNFFFYFILRKDSSGCLGTHYLCRSAWPRIYRDLPASAS